MKETEGGAEICMPKMRKRKPRLPKGFDPAHPPSTMPDPERWLPKWQRSKYKKYARKKAKYMKGGAVQGDAQIDTDVTNKVMGPSTATAATSKTIKKRKR